MAVITKAFEINQGLVKVHGLQTGQLAIKESALSSKKPGLWSILSSFKDKQFGIWLPIWSWLIEHPEGNFLIDTGLSTDVHQDNYFKSLDFVSRYYFEQQMKFKINKEEEIHSLLKSINIKPESIDKIILTHLHIDHTGGLKHFPNTPILVNQREWKTKDGSFPKLFPPNMHLKQLTLNQSYESFERSHFLTKNKDLVLVETQGHTRGHCSVILALDDNNWMFFAGDLAYTKERLVKKIFSATIKNHQQNIDSCNKVLAMTQNKSITFFPSHDAENEDRLLNL